MTFLELAQRRGTTRGFSPRPVDAPDLAYVLAARDRGLGSVLVGLFDPRILQREFHLPNHLGITAPIFAVAQKRREEPKGSSRNTPS